MLAATASASVDPAAVPTGTRPDDALRAATFTRHAVRTVRSVSASYVVDGLIMLGFVMAGTVTWMPVALYVLLGVTMGAAWEFVLRRGWTLRYKDPHLPMTMSVPHQILQIVGLVMLPQLAFMFLLILFIVMTALAMRARPLQTGSCCAVSCVALGLLVGTGHVSLSIPNNTFAEQLLVAAFVSATLWQCIYIGSYNGLMQTQLKKRSSELAALTAKVQELAHHDELTGLLNRRSLLNILTEECQRAERTGAPLSVAVLDIDRFKHINDTFGHPAGDQALKAMSATVRQLTRSTDRFGRYGGEEFLVILTNTGRDEALVPIERFREAMQARGWADVGAGLNVTFSCGISDHVPGESVEEMIRRADEALYRAKHDGRNCTRIAAPAA